MSSRRAHRRRLLLPAVAIVSWLALGAAGSYADQGGTCSPNGTSLSITAFDSKFDKSCLAAPAGQAFTIDLKNLDRGIPHNLSIYQDESAGKTLFKGDMVDGPGEAKYSVSALSEGKFFFRCDPHPDTMHGTFIVAKS